MVLVRSRHSVCIRESTSPVPCHSQEYGKKVGQAIESLWHPEAVGGPGYSTLIPIRQPGHPCD